MKEKEKVVLLGEKGETAKEKGKGKK